MNAAIKPRLSAIYTQCASLLTNRGHQIVDRAMKKGTVGGAIGMELLCQPAMLLSLVAGGDAVHELAVVAKDIPFIGNYGLWAPSQSVIAAT